MQKVPDAIEAALDSLLQPYNQTYKDLVNNNNEDYCNKIEKRFFSVKEATVYTGVNRFMLGRLAKNGHIKKIKTADAKSGKVLYEKTSLDRWLESRIVIPAVVEKEK